MQNSNENEELVNCCECDEEIPNDETYIWREGTYCEACIDEVSTVCDRCTERVNYDSITTVNYENVCESCYDSNFAYCESCDSHVYTDDYNHEVGYCRSCDDNFQTRRPTVHTNKFRNKMQGKIIKSPRTFGIELEVGGDTYDSLHGLKRDIDMEFGMVGDGSLSCENPIEIVSPILGGKKGEDTVIDLSKKLTKHGFSGEDESCGFHVHLDGSDFLPTEHNVVLNSDELDVLLKEVCADDIKRIIGVDESCLDFLSMSHKVENYKKIANWFNDLGSPTGRISILHPMTPVPVIGYNIVVGGMKIPCVSTGKDVVELEGRLSKISNQIRTFMFSCKNDDADKLGKQHNNITKQIARYSGVKPKAYVVRYTTTENFERLKTLLYFYTAYSDVINSMLPSHRTDGNQYCKPMRESFLCQKVERLKTQFEFEKLWYKKRDKSSINYCKGNHYDSSRYHYVNFHSLFNRHGTVEIRAHAGETDYRRILFWTALHQHILDNVSNGAVSIKDIKTVTRLRSLRKKQQHFIELLKLPKYLEEYVNRLFTNFSNQH